MANKKVENKKTTKKVNEETVKETVQQEKVSEAKKEKEVKAGKSGKFTILILAAIIVFLIALFLPGNNGDVPENLELKALKCDNDTDNIESTDDTNLNKVSCNGYQSLVEEQKDNLILIARPTCSYCMQFIPILEEIVDEYGITINYFDTDTLSSEENSQFYESSSLYSSDNFGTPTLIITNNNTIKDYSIGYMEKDATIDWLKDNGIIVE